jgi:uncharacterized SAM-dependent methyltransferase
MKPALIEKTEFTAHTVGDIVADALALLTSRKQGHMEKWEYAHALLQNDCAAGADFWADLVRHPGFYYPAEAETKILSKSLQNDSFLSQYLNDVSTVVELGPGSHEAILNKTIPFLCSCVKAKKYIIVDATTEQAIEAAETMHRRLNISVEIYEQDFVNAPLPLVGFEKKAIIMWGISLGNIAGHVGLNAYNDLVRKFGNFAKGMCPNDIILLCVDTEQDEEKVLAAYNEPSLKKQVLSVLHRLKRDGIATGNFDPHAWRHKPVWYAEVGQCAHTLYPTIDQQVHIAGHVIDIPAGTEFISNNSYKFKPSFVSEAALEAGLETLACLQDGPIALFVGKKI